MLEIWWPCPLVRREDDYWIASAAMTHKIVLQEYQLDKVFLCASGNPLLAI
jgi:hypothetical protein